MKTSQVYDELKAKGVSDEAVLHIMKNLELLERFAKKFAAMGLFRAHEGNKPDAGSEV